MDFLITAIDKESFLDLRLKTREAHLEYFSKNLIDIKMAGPLLKDSKPIGSIMVVAAKSRKEVEEWLKNEPYSISGLFSSVKIEDFKISVLNNKIL